MSRTIRSQVQNIISGMLAAAHAFLPQYMYLSAQVGCVRESALRTRTIGRCALLCHCLVGCHGPHVRIYISDISSHPSLDHLTSYPQVFVHCTSPKSVEDTLVVDKDLHPQTRRNRSVLDQDKAQPRFLHPHSYYPNIHITSHGKFLRDLVHGTVQPRC